MPAGELERSVEAISDDCVDRLAIAGTLDDCLDRIASYQGVVDELLLLNILPPADGCDAIDAYQPLMQLARATTK
jgi:alkanesulfonate monooxygenase SsuD/methylene tetrahydromethanopterin reductase-like flavin-dependent oxidoreductase (luciferase family)